MQKVTSQDILFMRRALQLAQKGRGRVHPNPLVGAVVTCGKKILSEGAHERYGGAHAEVNALRLLRRIPTTTTLYTTLEPCTHWGKTPPCVDFILHKKIRRVVIGMKDPNPLISGGGIRRLQKCGVQVITGVLEKEAEVLNRDFRQWILKKIPYVTVKIAQTLDGKIATQTGESRWITGEKARRFSHELRAGADAILVGVRTVLADDPRLNARLGSKVRHPVKVVLDCALRTPVTAKIFSPASPSPVLIFTTLRGSAKKRKALSKKAEIIVVKEKAKGYVDWRQTLLILGKRGIVNLLVEGGAQVFASAFQAGIVNEAYFFVAPRVIGDKRRLANAWSFREKEWKKVGEDFLFHGVC
jgi:diaminohydroxyphosphoribosylaminopyrimidine deaminase/5-amino-6-(5-phosphoribosylamino)uracil reductase